MTATVESARSILSAVEASWSRTESELLPLMRKNSALSPSELSRVASSVQRAAARDQVIVIGDNVFTGLARYALRASKGNLILAKEILSGPSPERNLNTALGLIDAAKTTLRSLRNVLSNIQTLQEWTGTGRSSSSLVRLGALGFEPVEWAAVALIASVVFLAVAAYYVHDIWVRSYNSERVTELANQACDRAEATGHPCTPGDFLEFADRAAQVQNQISPPPDPNSDPLNKLGDLVFWGGLLAVAAGVGYAVWTTLPAAQAFRSRSFAGMKQYRLVGPCGSGRGRIDCGMFETVDEAKAWVADYADRTGMKKLKWSRYYGKGPLDPKGLPSCNEWEGGAQNEPPGNWQTYSDFTITDCNHSGKPYRSLNGSV